MEQTPLQELMEFMTKNLYRGEALIYAKTLELLDKEKQVIEKAFNEGRHNGYNVMSQAPIKGEEYFLNTYSKADVNA